MNIQDFYKYSWFSTLAYVDWRKRSGLTYQEEILDAAKSERVPGVANIVDTLGVDDPSQYRWSSYRHNGLGQADTRITHHPLYPELGTDVTTRQAAYRALFRSQLDDEAIADIRLSLSQGQPLGSDRFSDAMCAAVGHPAQPEKSRATSSLARSDERYRNATRLWFLNGRQEMKKNNAKLTPLTTGRYHDIR